MSKKWEVLLKDYPDIIEEINGVLVAAKLLGYRQKCRVMDDKGTPAICFDFNKGKKELHLDIFFNKDNSLKEVCTCRGDCKSCCTSKIDNNFINPIDIFKMNL